VDQLVEHGAGAYDVWIPEGADTARVARGTVAPL